MLQSKHEKNKTLALTWSDDSSSEKERNVLNVIANAAEIDYNYLANLIEKYQAVNDVEAILLVQHFRSKAHL